MAMDVLVMRGASKGDCVDKIVKRYGAYFNILRERTISTKGAFGLFPREEYEVEFYIAPQRIIPPAQVAPQMAGSAPLSILNRERQVVGLPSIPQGDGTTLDFEEEKRKLIAAAGRDPEKAIKAAANISRKQEDIEKDQQTMLEMLREIQAKLDSQAEQKVEHPTLERIAQIMRMNDFSDSYAKRILERTRRELPLEVLENFELAQDRVLEWIGESVGVYRAAEHPPRRPGDAHFARVLALVGPTGVGKTTTIAKLAAIYGVGNVSRPKPLSVRMITTDMFRMGAEHQLEKYAKIMEIPVSFIDNHEDLKREIDTYREVVDLILVDTTGRSPKDAKGLGEVKHILDACGSKAEIHLVVSASTKTADIAHIMQQFEPFNYGAVLLTKLDETRHVGNVISALAEKGKMVSYVSHGQGVPKDIRKASIIQFLINLEEFRVDREAFEKRFPPAGADQFQWS